MQLARFFQFALILSAAFVLHACGGEASDEGASDTGASGDATAASPADAIRGMLALAEAGKWEEYVSSYYGEQHKMDDPAAQIPNIAARLEGMSAKVIEALRACVGETPKMADDGTSAVYANKFTLHKRDGKWGFHL